MQQPHDSQSDAIVEKAVEAFGGTDAARDMVLMVYSLGVIDGMLKFSEATNDRMVQR